MSVLVAACTPRATTGSPLVINGRSTYSIHYSADAPDSVRFAAAELQRILLISTGVQLPITHRPTGPIISLGQTAAADSAGLSSSGIPDDGFRIVTNSRGIFIVGKDTARDDPARSVWASNGTLYGTYDFAERALGVRWLLPGDWGEDIPQHSDLRIPQVDLTDSPDFAVRRLLDIQDLRPEADKGVSAPGEWLRRQRMRTRADGQGVQHWHAWSQYGMEQVLRDHPEYNAVGGDKNKFCTSHPDAVRAFADGVSRWLNEHPEQKSASISPTDGGGFCRCEKCQSLVTKDPHGNTSFTNLVLKFYNDVAQLVAPKHTDRVLGGYVYYNYMYPPNRRIAIEPNVYLVWAPLNYYGWGLQKPQYRNEFPEVLAEWATITPNLVYHNYSTWMRSFNGAPLPPGFDILKLEIPLLRKNRVRGAEMVGIGAWGYGGPTNYILARQLWHADVDVEAIWFEWLQRAYGPGWVEMNELYRMLEARMKVHKQMESPIYSGEQYEINYEVIEKVYVPVFPDMERLYLRAMSKVATAPQRRRLEMFGNNLIMLHYNMSQAGMLTEPKKSAFYRSGEQYREFLARNEGSISLYRGEGKRFTGPIWRGSWRGE